MGLYSMGELYSNSDIIKWATWGENISWSAMFGYCMITLWQYRHQTLQLAAIESSWKRAANITK